MDGTDVAGRLGLLLRAVPTCAGALLALWIAFLGTRTASQQAAWRDQRAFLETTIARGGDSARMFINLGQLESNAGNYDAARARYREALDRAPNQPLAWFGVANVAIRTRDFANARIALGKASDSPMLRAEVLQACAVLGYLESGRDTGELLAQAVEAAPSNWAIRKRWLEYLNERGRTPEAVRELSTLLERESFRAESWRMLGGMLEKLRQPDAAQGAYREAMRRDTRDAVSPARLAALDDRTEAASARLGPGSPAPMTVRADAAEASRALICQASLFGDVSRLALYRER